MEELPPSCHLLEAGAPAQCFTFCLTFGVAILPASTIVTYLLPLLPVLSSSLLHCSLELCKLDSALGEGYKRR